MDEYQEHQDIYKRDKAKIVEGGMRYLATLLASIAIAYSRYVSNHIESIDADIQRIKIINAETTANRFTSADWNRERTSITDAININDKRITRDEDALIDIRRRLDRIERPKYE